jgi:diguanylate cyclase (GGDEF)-like protein
MKPKDTLDTSILLADQDVVLCVSARRALQRLGFSVTLAHDGANALERFDSDPFDLVIVGAALPGRNGLQILRDIKKRNPQMPVILMGDALSELAALATREGAAAYVPTPTDDFRNLIEAVDRALASQTQEPRKPGMERPPASAPAQFDAAKSVAALREMIESAHSQPMRQTIRLLLEASAQLLNAPYAVILLTQPDSSLQFFDAFGFSDQDAAARDFVRRVGDAFAWRVATERQTLIDALSTFEESEPAVRYIGTPLVVHDQLVGVLIVYPLPGETVAPERVTWLETFAAQGALVVQLSRLDDANERLSPNDPVTGVLKRAVFLDLADHEFRRSWRYNQPIGVIIVDVDKIQDINARHGRAFGDQVMHQVASACRHIVRSIDLVGRYEGDSFALLLLMTEREGARSVAERLRARIATLEISDERGPFLVTATLGVCAYPRENCSSIFDLLTVAQEAQQAAKRSGANQIVVA